MVPHPGPAAQFATMPPGAREAIVDNPVVHFELNGPDPAGLARFYADLFGWRIQETPGGYWLIDTHAGAGINEGIGRTEDETNPGLLQRLVRVGDRSLRRHHV